MLYVRFHETFRERSTEWGLSLGLLFYGLITHVEQSLFSQHGFFEPLLHILSQESWAWTLIVVGLTRFIFLVVNGAWRPSAHIRAIGCGLGAMVWGSFLLSAFTLDYTSPIIAVYGMLLGLDLLSLWFAAGDAKVADVHAKKLHKAGG